MKPFQYIRPSKVTEAIDAATADLEASFIAGGTNIVDLMKRGISSPSKLIDISGLPLKKIEQKYGYIRVGALVSNSEVAGNKLINHKLPLLAQALRAGASGQLRNMATVGGNLLQQTRCTYFYDTAFPCNKRQPGQGCSAVEGVNRMHAIFGFDKNNLDKSCIAVHPGDMGVALSALNASVVVAGKTGERTISVADFYPAPAERPERYSVLERNELIVAVEIPDSSFGQHVHYLKVRDRASYAFALMSVAAALDIQQGQINDARVVLGSVAYKPWRLQAVEKMLIGKLVSESTFTQAAEVAMAGAQSFGDNAYKLKLAPNIIIEALKIASGIS